MWVLFLLLSQHAIADINAVQGLNDIRTNVNSSFDKRVGAEALLQLGDDDDTNAFVAFISKPYFWGPVLAVACCLGTWGLLTLWNRKKVAGPKALDVDKLQSSALISARQDSMRNSVKKGGGTTKSSDVLTLHKGGKSHTLMIGDESIRKKKTPHDVALPSDTHNEKLLKYISLISHDGSLLHKYLVDGWFFCLLSNLEVEVKTHTGKSLTEKFDESRYVKLASGSETVVGYGFSVFSEDQKDVPRYSVMSPDREASPPKVTQRFRDSWGRLANSAAARTGLEKLKSARDSKDKVDAASSYVKDVLSKHCKQGKGQALVSKSDLFADTISRCVLKGTSPAKYEIRGVFDEVKNIYYERLQSVMEQFPYHDSDRATMYASSMWELLSPKLLREHPDFKEMDTLPCDIRSTAMIGGLYQFVGLFLKKELRGKPGLDEIVRGDYDSDFELYSLLLVIYVWRALAPRDKATSMFEIVVAVTILSGRLGKGMIAGDCGGPRRFIEVYKIVAILFGLIDFPDPDTSGLTYGYETLLLKCMREYFTETVDSTSPSKCAIVKYIELLIPIRRLGGKSLPKGSCSCDILQKKFPDGNALLELDCSDEASIGKASAKISCCGDGVVSYKQDGKPVSSATATFDCRDGEWKRKGKSGDELAALITDMSCSVPQCPGLSKSFTVAGFSRETRCSGKATLHCPTGQRATSGPSTSCRWNEDKSSCEWSLSPLPVCKDCECEAEYGLLAKTGLSSLKLTKNQKKTVQCKTKWKGSMTVSCPAETCELTISDDTCTSLQCEAPPSKTRLGDSVSIDTSARPSEPCSATIKVSCPDGTAPTTGRSSKCLFDEGTGKCRWPDELPRCVPPEPCDHPGDNFNIRFERDRMCGAVATCRHGLFGAGNKITCDYNPKSRKCEWDGPPVCADTCECDLSGYVDKLGEDASIKQGQTKQSLPCLGAKYDSRSSMKLTCDQSCKVSVVADKCKYKVCGNPPTGFSVVKTSNGDQECSATAEKDCTKDDVAPKASVSCSWDGDSESCKWNTAKCIPRSTVGCTKPIDQDGKHVRIIGEVAKAATGPCKTKSVKVECKDGYRTSDGTQMEVACAKTSGGQCEWQYPSKCDIYCPASMIHRALGRAKVAVTTFEGTVEPISAPSSVRFPCAKFYVGASGVTVECSKKSSKEVEVEIVGQCKPDDCIDFGTTTYTTTYAVRREGQPCSRQATLSCPKYHKGTKVVVDCQPDDESGVCKWAHHQAPKCEARQCSASPPAGLEGHWVLIEANSGAPVEESDVCSTSFAKYGCANGFRVENGVPEHSINCRQNDEKGDCAWELSSPSSKCSCYCSNNDILAALHKLPAWKHVHSIPARLTLADSASTAMDCGNGYSGRLKISCTATATDDSCSATVTTDNTECRPKQCELLPGFEDLDRSSREEPCSNSAKLVHCDKGFKLPAKSDPIQCRRSGKECVWAAPIPHCIAKQCANPNSEDYDLVEPVVDTKPCSNFLKLKACDKLEKVSGTAKVQCQETSTGECRFSSIPTCEGTYSCPHHSIVDSRAQWNSAP
jgi:hypothetical protein